MASYTAAQQAQGQRAMIQEGVFSRAMEGVTGGVILAGFALALGANDLEIGLIAAIPFLAQLAHVPAVGILARVRDRRRLCAGAAAASRVLFFAMAALPFVALPFDPVAALVVLLAAYAALATLAAASWQVWVRELVPREALGRYFGRRMMVLGAVGLVTIVAAGQFVLRLGGGGRQLEAFALLFAFGGLAGLASAGLLLRAPSLADPPLRARPLAEALRQPLRDRNYRRVLVFLGAWGFSANVALPFVSVVLLRDLGYSVALVTVLAAVSSLSNIAGLRLWAPLTDRFGNKPVLGLAAGVFLVAMLVWTLTLKEPGAGVLASAVVMHVLLGFAIAGLDVASNGLVMKLAPDPEVPSYLASASVVKALAAGVSPLLGGLAATLLAGREFRMQLVWSSPAGESVATALRFGPHDFLLVVSLAVGLYAVHRLLGFQEEGEAPEEEVMRAMRRELVQPTSVAGMRAFAHVASYVVEAGYRFERAFGSPPREGRENEKRPPEKARP